MGLPSSSRNGARVIWVALHTAEGSRRTGDLYAFFDRNQNASSHAGADGIGLSDGWVDINRSAWTLLNGNPRSVNLEMCGFARWTREQWLSTGTVDGVVNPRNMVRNAALWARRMCDTFGVPRRKLTPAQVGRGESGVLMHWDYSLGTGDGDHWDIGDGFPWDVFFNDLNGITTEDDMPFGVPNPVQWEPGSDKWGVLAVPPVGGSLSVGDGGQAWVHLRCPNRPVKIHGVWLVHYNGNLLEEIPEFELKHDSYWAKQLPKGCSQVSVKYSGEVPIGATLETRA